MRTKSKQTQSTLMMRNAKILHNQSFDDKPARSERRWHKVIKILQMLKSLTQLTTKFNTIKSEMLIFCQQSKSKEKRENGFDRISPLKTWQRRLLKKRNIACTSIVHILKTVWPQLNLIKLMNLFFKYQNISLSWKLKQKLKNLP